MGAIGSSVESRGVRAESLPGDAPSRSWTEPTAAAADRDLPTLVAGRRRAWLVLYGAPAAFDPDHRAGNPGELFGNV